jgi:hypothetical protein
MSVAKFQIMNGRVERAAQVKTPRKNASGSKDKYEDGLGSHTEPNAINTGVGPKALHYPTSIYDADQS